MEVGEGGEYIYTYRYIVTTRMTPAFRWAALRAFFFCDGQSHDTVSTNHNLSEEKGEAKRNRAEVLPLISLTPYR